MYRFAENVHRCLGGKRDLIQESRNYGPSRIAHDLRKFINNPEYSGVVFLCNDGVRVHASRLHLAARSKFFHGMLKTGMVESQLSEITLSELSSAQLLPVMEYLCTGDLSDHAPEDSTEAFQILIAADFFSITDLAELAVERLLDALTEAKQDVTATASFLSIIVDFMAIHGKAVEIIARELSRILLFNSLQPEHLHALSKDAFLYYLEATKSEDVEPKFLTGMEFLRFRNIVLWCACKEFAPEESIATQVIRPEIWCTKKLLEKLPQQRECLTGEQFETYRKMKEQLRLSVCEYLPLVQLQRISPEIIKNIVEPMDIVPPSDIKETLEVHAALQLSFMTEEDILGWSIVGDHSENKQHKVYERGSLLKQVALSKDYTFAQYNLVLNRHVSGRIYIWEIIIEEVCEGFIDIGLYAGYRNSLDTIFYPLTSSSLYLQNKGFALRLDPTGMHLNRRGHFENRSWDKHIPYDKDFRGLVYGKDYGQKNSKIRVCLDMTTSECSFVIDDQNLGVAWTGLGDRFAYTPAVSLGTGSQGAVSLRFISVT